LIEDKERLIKEAAKALKTGNVDELANRAALVANESKEKDKQISQLTNELASIKAKSVLENAKDVGCLKLITAVFENMSVNDLRSMCDNAKQAADNAVVVAAGTMPEKGTVNFCCVCAKEAVNKGAHAGNIVRQVAKIADGNGGGKPESAMAGGKDISKARDAVDASYGIVLSMIGDE
ncbi:MAG: alanine--tRNA ligase, partial [Oscillospiraceae bacterium]|nr:alanine--tRNA ligase [Oscillospiraceae bacterium]